MQFHPHLDRHPALEWSCERAKSAGLTDKYRTGSIYLARIGDVRKLSGEGNFQEVPQVLHADVNGRTWELEKFGGTLQFHVSTFFVLHEEARRHRR